MSYLLLTRRGLSDNFFKVFNVLYKVCDSFWPVFILHCTGLFFFFLVRESLQWSLCVLQAKDENFASFPVLAFQPNENPRGTRGFRLALS